MLPTTGNSRRIATGRRSTDYRRYKEEGIFGDHFQPGDIEREIVEKARRERFSPGTSTGEILTELRHFRADTALVDFSRSLFVALFFACTGDEDEDGRFYMLPATDLEDLDGTDVHAKGRDRAAHGYMRPARGGLSKSRVEAQGSIFIHSRQGFVDEERLIRVCIPKGLKKDCLRHLDLFHDINGHTIYNDLFGWIDNQENFKTARQAAR